MPAAASCSVLTAQAGVPLVGTAGTYSCIVAVELASPWAAKLRGSPAGDAALDAALKDLDDRVPGVRVLLFDGDGRSEDGFHRILVFERAEQPFRGFTRREITTARSELAATLNELVISAGCDSRLREERDGTSRPIDAPPPPLAGASGQGRDLFVCTHGSRDACCGKLGFPLYRHLRDRLAAPGLRVWRCSHLGGHRFAPTMLDLPSGRLYGRLETADADWLTVGDATIERISQTYRGLCVLPEPAQVLEREMWIRHGLRWLDAALGWSVDKRKDAKDSFEVSVSATWSDRTARLWRAGVCESREGVILAAESCGKEPKKQRPWTITSLREEEA